MRRFLPVLALVLAGFAGAATPVSAAPHEWHFCPAEARGAVSHNGDASWIATTQSSRLMDMRVGPIGGIVALICVYNMFGGEYWIYKHPSGEMPDCQPQTTGDGRRGFYCRPL